MRIRNKQHSISRQAITEIILTSRCGDIYCKVCYAKVSGTLSELPEEQSGDGLGSVF